MSSCITVMPILWNPQSLASHCKQTAMNQTNLLTADILDILFEGRNKAYGAYELRKQYQKRLYIAVSSMLLLVALLFAGYAFSEKMQHHTITAIIPPDMELSKVKPNEEVIPPPPPEIKPPTPVAMEQFAPPRIVHDDEVTPEDQPPTMEELENVQIGLVDKEGSPDEGITAPPPSDEGRGVLEAPKAKSDPDSLFISVQIESEYPGGPQAWMRYLKKTLEPLFPAEAIEEGIQGTVLIRFIVDREGNVSNVEAVSGPELLREAAIKVIQKSGKWTPALQNGMHVRSYKTQPIVFRIDQ